MNPCTVWQIALPTPLWRLFDYSPCVNQRSAMVAGMRVSVPFGRRELVGIYLQSLSETDIALNKLKAVTAVLDDEPVLCNKLLALCRWASDYYHYPLGEVLLGAIPKALREGKALALPEKKTYRITDTGRAALLAGINRSPKQKQWLEQLAQQAFSDQDIKTHAISRAVIKRVIENDWVCVKTESLLPTGNAECEAPLVLNDAQQQALTTISNQDNFGVSLLAGITGSGKTEVYLQAIDHIIKQGKQALVLVPEISLTPQTVGRFQRRFSVPISVLHSGLSDTERARMWLYAKKGLAPIVIGTRSAIFAPLQQLGMIIVDEEHDLSFKSQSRLRYSARDMAVVRGQFEKIPVVLGSATPSLESYYNVMRERYHLLSLPERAGNAKPPLVRVVDLRQCELNAGLSPNLIKAIRAQLDLGKQVLLFLNRRGYAPVMMCHACGHTIQCNHCDARLIFHAKRSQLICHHCDKIMPTVRICPDCHQAELIPLGQGTERLESALHQLFPDKKILRIDRDTTASKDSLNEKIELVNAREVDVLVGTQMLAKGHHFPHLGLSAVIDMDSAFFSLDFRAIERMAQLLVQVSGRAGRGEDLGEVVIQTHQPDHPYLQLLLQKGYFEFIKSLLQERETVALPPYSFQAIVRAESHNRVEAAKFLNQVKRLMLQKEVQAFGPMPALLERKAGKFRQQLTFQSSSRAILKACLNPLIKKILELPEARRVRWSVDVDPTEVL